MAFVRYQLATGSNLRTLTVVDTFSRFSLAVVPWFGFRAPEVIEMLERVCNKVGYRTSIRVDQVSEFVSRDFDRGPMPSTSIVGLRPFGFKDRSVR